MAIDRKMNMVMNELLTRAQMWKAFLDPDDRDLDKECGYPDVVGPKEYHQMYEREGVGTRVVHCLPDESWAEPPTIYEIEDARTTEFEKGIDLLNKETRLIHFLHRADVLSGIGRFGVLLLGLDDGKPMHEEASSGEKRKLIYLRAFDESVVTVATREMDTKSPRYSLPTSYTINYTDESGIGTSARESVGVTVHWSRVIHLADNRGMSEVYGTPRMLPVWNRLLDIRKILGGSAEMFWRGAFPGFSFEVNPELLAQGVELDKTTMREEFEKYANGLQRYMAMTGVSTRSLAPQVVSPREQVETHLKAIAITVGIPFRVLFGSEQAELASSQDSKTWLKRVNRRREEYVTPLIIRPTIDRLISLGVLPEPAEEYQVEWPDLSAPSDMEKAQLGVTRTQALQSYVAGQVDQLIPPRQFLMGVVGMEVEEVDAIEEAAVEYAEEKAEEQEAQAQEQAAQAQAQGEQQPSPQGPGAPPGEGRGGQKPPFGKPPTGNEGGDQWLQVKPGDFVVHETGEGFVVNLAGSSALVGVGKKGTKQKLQRVHFNLLQAVKVKDKGPIRKVLEYDEKTELHRVANFDPDQPRDEDGKWTDTGGGGGGGSGGQKKGKGKTPGTGERHDFGNGPVAAHRHENGGGWVADTAKVAKGAKVDLSAKVSGNAVVGPFAAIYGEAVVTGNAKVLGSAQISGRAQVSGNAVVEGRAEVTGNALVTGSARVFGRARLTDNAQVFHRAKVSGDAIVEGHAYILDSAIVTEGARIGGDAQIDDRSRIEGNAYVGGNVRVKGTSRISGDAKIEGDVRVLGDTVLSTGAYKYRTFLGTVDVARRELEKRKDEHAAILKEELKGRERTPEQLSGVGTYTSTLYTSINSPLRQGKKLDPELAGIVKDIDKAMAPLKKDRVLYRGVDGIPGVADWSKMVGKVIEDKAFMSTAVSDSKAFGGEALFVIRAPAGVKAAVGYTKEDEIILARGTRLKVKDVTRLRGRSHIYGWRVTAEVVTERKQK